MKEESKKLKAKPPPPAKKKPLPKSKNFKKAFRDPKKKKPTKSQLTTEMKDFVT